ncbi:Phage integrase family protein [Pseudoruegeria aquimaris]|uniref:Phage integrase family protein n=1 Tax=Pseudoruegeria aquimaris TaxID=393663 RepID=A0A1Y5RCK9_9RHOB|nr:tyrosine-type recombinase/integrase [Pseudoruegeria aquimaris]SLN14170.1 Phage integrase family protein [Pseudoruegeria aquimaris]
MGVMMKLRGLSELGQGRWEYRRRVPEAAKAALGKGEWKRVIKARSDADLMRCYALVEAEFEREVAAVKAPRKKLTPRAAWEEALREADEVASGVVGLDGDDAREVAAESMASLGRSPLVVQALMDPERSPPPLTLEDAREVYVKEKLGGGLGAEHRGAMVRLERVMRMAEDGGLSAATPLASITREHARKVRDHMLAREKLGGGAVAPSSVKRELGLLRTVVSYGSRELGLLDLVNPFDRLPVEGLASAEGRKVAARDKVAPLPPKIELAIRSKLTGELYLIWRILTGTGCRLGEVTGLRVEDVVLEGATPCIRIQWNEVRRLKTQSSIRSVPLLGDALEAAREATEAAEGGTFLFPRYARERGADAASAALMKHLRKFTTDKRHKVHSLRHGLKDRMRIAGVDKVSQDIVLGHAPSNIGETYGGEEGLLAVALRALKAVEESEGLAISTAKAD